METWLKLIKFVLNELLYQKAGNLGFSDLLYLTDCNE